MRWQGNEESSNLEDRRRSGAPVVIGGGGLLLVVIVALLFGVDPKKINQLVNQAQGGGNANVAAPQGDASPAELNQRKFMATILRFTEVVWTDQFAKAGKQYTPPKMVLFADRVQTGCGVAPSAVGPFYCPEDRTVYLDPSFFLELDQKLGGSKSEFSQAYVIAHEIGHHVQNLLGYSDFVDRQRQRLPEDQFNEWSVRLELQADYLAGVWANHGQEKFNFIEPGDVESAITSANAIGDDRLQKRSIGFTSPEKYTHGTSAQRVAWFKRGLQTGDMSMLKQIFEMPYERL